MARLTPYPFGALVRRIFRELERNESVFELPARKLFRGEAGRDLSTLVHGERVSSPLGLAAGPHTQMAQNIVLGWIAGARVFELKTVQVRDELEIPRPCIDMETVGFNVEWSQELALEQSHAEYAKAALLVEMLRASGHLALAPGFDRSLFDISVGYDLAGIRSAPVRRFIEGLIDARPLVDKLRLEIPAEHAALRDLEFPVRLARTATLSTFHGCPPDEIESIAEFLMGELGLGCTLKLNPTLLGREETLHWLHDVLGYHDIRFLEGAFERDAKWADITGIVDRLGRAAAARGLHLGVKFTNTLVVENTSRRLPASEKEAYLSGPPLHLLAVNLVKRFRDRFGDAYPVSFSAGIDRHNVADALALGLAPITVCTDLLKPGGFGRLRGYYRELFRRMDAVGARSASDFILRAYGLGKAALDAVAASMNESEQQRCREAFQKGGELRSIVATEAYEKWVSAAKLLNTEHYREVAAADPCYSHLHNSKPPRKTGRALDLFDCSSCDICVGVCPNGAIFTFGSGEAQVPIVRLRRLGERWLWCEEGEWHLDQEHQVGVFADFCNDCGNCDVFCPEDGGPYRVKPRFFGSESAWRASATLEGFWIGRRAGEAGEPGDVVLARFRGGAYRLEACGGKVSCSGPGFTARFEEADPPSTVAAEGPDIIDLTPCLLLDFLRRAVLDEDRANSINSLAGCPGG
ncbi:MAG: glutamate synthase [Planctomycetota bacterium]